MDFAEYIELKKLDPSEVTKEQAFRFGQVSVVALFADYLHISLSWDNWEKSIDRVFANAEEASGSQEKEA